MKMNTYTITFPFKGDYYFTQITANEFANEIAIKINADDMLDMACEHEQCFGFRFTGEDKKTYLAGFAYDNIYALNVYETNGKDPDDNEYDEFLVEKDIPYLILKVVNDDKEIYNLNDCL